MAERWRPVEGFPEYEVGDLGNVRRVLPAPGATVGKVLAQCGGGGRLGKYLRVTLSQRGRKSTKSVHVLVAVAFHGDRRGNGMTVDHVDDNTEHNAAANLRWITVSANSTKGNAKKWSKPGEVKPWDPAAGVSYSPPGEA